MDPQTRADRCERALAAHGDAVFRLALAQTRSAADAQDVSQDVFIRLLREERAFRSEEHMLAWLLRATVNRCRDLHKSAWRNRVDLEGAQSADAPGSPADALARIPDADDAVEDQAIAALEAHPVWRHLDELDSDQRAVVHLRYVEELTDAQIAKVLGISPVTVRTRLHRARRHLRTLMLGDPDTPGAHARNRGANPAQTKNQLGGVIDARSIE